MVHKESEAAGEHKRERGWSGLTLTTAAFLFLLLRLFAVSGYQWHTAFAVLHTLDLEDSIGIVLGTVMADSVVAAVLLAVLLPAFLFRVVGGYLLAARVRRLRAERPDGAAPGEGRPLPERGEGPERADGTPQRPVTGWLDLPGLGMLAIVLAGVTAYILSFHAWWLLPLSVAVTALMAGLGAVTRGGHGQVGAASRWAGKHLMGLVMAAVVVTLLVSAAVVRTPWMPLERVEVKERSAPLIGYVLEAEPGFLKFMTEKDRHFLILNEGDVKSREEIVDH
ncbi:hypothetical protein ACFYVL_18705 [Streptomyces sp. NPDC004111]|uniref:hypothetical protein n=1 Tax=Streptomyces sp. NPDC004111 TaxID=3364690 RepID=UPI00368C3DCA